MPLVSSSAIAAILGVLVLAQDPTPAPVGPEGDAPKVGRKGVPVAKRGVPGGGKQGRGAGDGPRLTPIASQYIETETLDPGADRKIVTFDRQKEGGENGAIELRTLLGVVVEQNDTKVRVKTAGEEIEIPAASVKSIRPIDGKGLLDLALASIGAAKLDAINGMSYDRFSRFWTGNAVFCIEAPHVRTFLNARLAGRVDTKSRNAVHPINGRPEEFAVVENGQDRFFLRNRTQVLSSAQIEKQASAEYRTELVLFLAPWIAAKYGTEVEHVGFAQLETFEPKKYQLPPKDYVKPNREQADPDTAPDDTDVEDVPMFGWTEYAPVTRAYEVVRVEMPDDWAISCGPSLWLLLDPVDAHPVGFRFEASDLVRPEHVGRGVVTYWIIESAEVEGVRLPKVLDASREGSAHRSERIEFSPQKIVFASGLADADLARP